MMDDGIKRSQKRITLETGESANIYLVEYADEVLAYLELTSIIPEAHRTFLGRGKKTDEAEAMAIAKAMTALNK